MSKSDRQQLLAETRLLLKEIAEGGLISRPEAETSIGGDQSPDDDNDATKDITLDVLKG